MDRYASSGTLADILLIITGTTYFWADSSIQQSILDRARQCPHFDSDIQEMIPVILMLPQQLEVLPQLVSQLSSKQRIVIFWRKGFFDSLDSMRRMLVEFGLMDIGLAYLLPNISNPSHLVMTDGVAIKSFYRARAGRFLLRRMFYSLNLLKYFEKSLICWAKAS